MTTTTSQSPLPEATIAKAAAKAALSNQGNGRSKGVSPKGGRVVESHGMSLPAQTRNSPRTGEADAADPACYLLGSTFRGFYLSRFRYLPHFPLLDFLLS